MPETEPVRSRKVRVATAASAGASARRAQVNRSLAIAKHLLRIVNGDDSERALAMDALEVLALPARPK